MSDMRNKGITLDEFFEVWEKNRKGTIKDSTERTVAERYKSISSFIVEGENLALGSIILGDIRRPMVLELQRSLMERDCSSTANSIISLLNTLFKDAMNERMIE